MKDYLNKLPKEIQDLIAQASRIAKKDNIPIYLVGGFVRDLLLQAKNLDLDIVVEGSGLNFSEDLARALGAKLIQHKRFGTATVILGGQMKIDITTARNEFYQLPAALPVVSSGTLKEDLFRRDFTINAMAIDISSDNFGRLIDFFGGKEDLENRKICIMHNLSFIDDPTRILRAIRFEQRYDFRLESMTEILLREAVAKKMLEKVQPHRTRDDLILVLKERKPIKEIKRIQELASFAFIHPKLSVTKEHYGLLRTLEKEINWFKARFPQRRPLDSWILYFMGLINGLSASDAASICRRFAFKRGEEKRILSVKKIKRQLISQLTSKKSRPSVIFDHLEPLSYEAIILLKAKFRNPVLQKNIRDFFRVYNGMCIQISGGDLHNLGVKPGPAYQKLFQKVLQAKLNGEVDTEEEELRLIRKIIKCK